MTDPLSIPAGERGVVRLFALDMPAQQARFLSEPGAAAQMLGVSDLDPTQIDILRIADLSDIGLAGYLIQGSAVPADTIDRRALNAITGHVLVIRSRALRGQPATLAPDSRLTLIGVYRETPVDWRAPPARPARPLRRQSPRATRTQARRVGASIFAVFMLLIVIVIGVMAT